MADISFGDLKVIIDGLNNTTVSYKGQGYTVADLRRMGFVYLSHSTGVADRLSPTKSWGQDRSYLEQSKYYLGFGHERSDATKEFKHPQEKTISR